MTGRLIRSDGSYAYQGDGIDDRGIQSIKQTGDYVGYSTEDKSVIAPNPERGNDFLELDTKDIYIYDGTQWVKFS